MLGFKTSTVMYERGERLRRKQNPLKMLLKLAFDGYIPCALNGQIHHLARRHAVYSGCASGLSVVSLTAGHTSLGWKIVTISVWGVARLILLPSDNMGIYGPRYMELKGGPAIHRSRRLSRMTTGHSGRDCARISPMNARSDDAKMHGFRFFQSDGQYFLIDGTVPEKIASASGIDDSFGVLEIGPGIGAMGRACSAGRAAKLLSVTGSTACCPLLEETLAAPERQGHQRRYPEAGH
jgi:hypothetical protein